MKKQPFAIVGKLTSRIGNPVSFSPPVSMKNDGGSTYYGTIIDEVWANEKLNSSKPRKAKSKNDWGDYSFFSQLIEWEDGERQIRLGYYRRPAGEKFWRFASQTTVTASWEDTKALLEKTLKKKDWFKNLHK